MIKDLLEDAQERMAKVEKILNSEFVSLRTGRATPSLLEKIMVDYYGTPTPVNQTSTISCPEPRMIMIQPWDVSVIKEIEKAILKSDLGLTPSNDGKIIRISIPPLTEERRKELVKIINKISEDHKIAVRNIRRDSNELLKGLKKDGDISEDDAFKAQDQIQKITDEHIQLIDDVNKEKEKEILEF